MKIKTGDTVLVTAGKNKGTKGKVMRVMKKRDQIVVEKVNLRKKHIKKTTTRAGEIITYEAPINHSNVKIICPHCKKAVRAGYQKLENGKNQRICKKCKATLDQLESQRTKK